MQEKIYKILKENKEIMGLAEYLIEAGAGTILPDELRTEKERLISWELATALAEPRAGEWETGIGKMVLAEDKEKMRKMAKGIFADNPCCPHCRYVCRLVFRKRTKDYLCRHCKHTWKF